MPLFRSAVESSPIGILVCEESGSITFANQQLCAIFGHQPEALIGRSVDDLVPSALRIARNCSLETAVGSSTSPGLRAVRSLPGRRQDGTEVVVEVGWTVVDTGARREFVGFIDAAHEPAKQKSLERLVTDLAARVVDVGADQVDQTITDSLREIAEALGVDRSTWWQVSEESGDLVAAYTWTAEEYRGLQSGESAKAQVPWILSRVQRGEVVAFDSVEDLDSAPDREGLHRFSTKSGAAVPFLSNGRLHAVLGFSALRKPFAWTPEVLERLRLVAAVFGQALMRKESERRLRDAEIELDRLRRDMATGGVHWRRDIRLLEVPHLVVAESAAARRVVEQIESVAPTNATVLLMGETGTGKEVFAQAIHRASGRHTRPMVTVNCGALPPTLIESELFGRERGAFTGALARQIGRFEMAQNSTIFLDEIGDLPLEAQVKLLRVLQERVVERLGGGQPVKVNVRIIAATNRDLKKAVEEHTFREDLFYRLNVFPITVPPLRDRIEDIPALVWTFIEEAATAFRKPIESLSSESLTALKRYSWPGNVRELRNVIERAVIIARGPRLVVELPSPLEGAPAKSVRLADVESEQIRRVLESVGWRVRGKGGAAELLGIKPNTLDSRMAKLGVKRLPRQLPRPPMN
jgi:PAS domain S-box-containing protein